MTTNQKRIFILKNPKMGTQQMATQLGLSTRQVREHKAKIKAEGLTIKQLEADEVTQGIGTDRTIRKLQEGKSATDKKNKALLDQIEVLEDEKEAILEIKNNIKPFVIKPSKGKGREAAALWVASDWHVAEHVTFGQTNGINEYNLAISKARGERFFKSGLKLTDMSAKEVRIKTIILALLGDFITGHLHAQAVETNLLPPVHEIQYAQNIIISGIQYILDNSSYDLVIPCHSGNHGRTTKFSEFGSENGHSWEFFMYCNIASYFHGEKRVQVHIAEGAHSYHDVFNTRIRFLHGHDVKYGGGVGGITIPLNKAIAQWDIANKADLTVCGHFHQRTDTGRALVNGSLIGYNSFALSIKASAEKPQQTFALIDSKEGKTIVAPILVDKE